VFKNELLNRSALSSAASAARRALIARMLEHPGTVRLGLEGNPPEAAMYESLLREGGFHVADGSSYVFRPPIGAWSPVWEAIASEFHGSGTGRVAVSALFERLKAPPFGLRDGPLPVLLCATLLARDEELGLYEEGVLVPE